MLDSSIRVFYSFTSGLKQFKRKYSERRSFAGISFDRIHCYCLRFPQGKRMIAAKYFITRARGDALEQLIIL